jgi:serine phosphatase RsbU (regulator of sigma subunit)
VRYVPRHARHHAGRDWYDAFLLPDGRFGIVIGDVGGRGIEAAATMGQIRNALRAYAVKGAPSPSEVIDDLHTLVEASAGAITFVTVIVVAIDPRTGDGELASAGHLPALIAGRGFVDAPRCPPLGFSDPDPCSAGRFTLAPGETLWLYTDGLIESRRRVLDDGLALLEDTAARAQGTTAEIADRLLVELPASRDDDIALLGLRRA